MTVPSQMSLRRIPTCLHLHVRIAYATSWEALIDTHTRQAVQFVTEFAPRIAALRGLDLYFHVIGGARVDARGRPTADAHVARAQDAARAADLPTLTGWHRFRLDLQLEHQRYRRRYHERTIELARMVGSRAAEAVWPPT